MGNLRPEEFVSEEIISVISNLKQNFELRNITKLITKDTNNRDIGFIDLVMEGGGVKGIATVGAIFALEQLGLRFRKVAGTSAGAINASFLAVGNDPRSEKSFHQLNILANKNFFDFVDGGNDAQTLVKDFGNKNSGLLKRIISGLRNAGDLWNRYGINPGDEFRKFINDALMQLNNDKPFTVAELKHSQFQNQKILINNSPLVTDFQLVVSDVSYEDKSIFPKDLPAYVISDDRILVGDLVRASMSIPFFFEPFLLSQFVGQSNLKDNEDIVFVDGGVVSNFPLAIFDSGRNSNSGDYKKPQCPTFGLLIDEKLGTPRKPNSFSNLFKFSIAIFGTASEYGDKSYIKENPHAQERIIRISNEVGNGLKIGTTDFDVSDEDKKKLFKNGVDAVVSKLKNWNFDDYIKKFRS